VDQTGLQGVSPENVWLMCLIAEGLLCSCEAWTGSKKLRMNAWGNVCNTRSISIASSPKVNLP
jgi:hypothetical protein